MLPLLDFRDDLFRVAGNEPLRGTIDDEIERFEDDGADQGRRAAFFDDGVEHSAAAAIRKMDSGDHAPLGRPTVGVANTRFA